MFWTKDQLFTKSLNVMQTHRYVTGVDQVRPAFMLSYDTADVLAERLGGRQYGLGDISSALLSTNNFSPSGRSTSPWSAQASPDGKLRVRWNPSTPETAYPALDRKAVAAQGPVQSFAFFTSQCHVPASHSNRDTPFWEKLAVAQKGKKGLIIYLVGTVGPKGSGADLELEDIENWRPGRPIFLPENTLTLPFQMIRGAGTEQDPASPYTPMVKTGLHGNIALLGTNGLTAESFTASYNSDNAPGAFDGWQGGSRKVIQEAGTLYGGRGEWEGILKFGPQWLQVNFGQVVSGISGFSIRGSTWDRVFEKEEDWFEAPRSVRMEASMDGMTFQPVWEGILPSSGFEKVGFPEAVTAQVLRLILKGAQGSSTNSRVAVRSMEIYQADD